MNIEKEKWHKCKLCQKTIKDLAKEYGGNGIYFTKVFEQHLLNDHKTNLSTYFANIEGGYPTCQCHQCGQLCKVSKKGANFYWKDYVCGRYIGTMKWAEKAKISRKGKNNPMYGHTAWNIGLTKETSEAVKSVSEQMKNRIVSKETKQKQSISAQKRLIHGHTGHKHTEATKEFFRQHTLQMIKDGIFKQTQTKPSLIVKLLLEELSILFEQEKIVSYWSFDFYLPDYRLYIEVDGDYFHANPNTRWPTGPITKTQKINCYRDKKKNKYCEDNNLNLIRFWEYDILHYPEKIKEIILCKVKELSQSSI